MLEQIFAKTIAWAETEETVRAAIIEGSRARRDSRIDRFSDYDLNLFVTDRSLLTRSDDWIHQLGPVWAMEKLNDPDDIVSRLVLFAGGYDIDFKLVPLAQLQACVAQQILPEEYHRGYTVVLDKDGLAAQLPPPNHKAAPRPKPTEEQFVYAVNVFWFELDHLVKYLHRGDLWQVKTRDAGIKNRLLQMIEWHARASHGWDYDTWMVGKNMQSWVAPDLWQAFFDIFARFDAADSWRAVLALMPLYRRLASEIAKGLGYTYPLEMDRAISSFILETGL